MRNIPCMSIWARESSVRNGWRASSQSSDLPCHKLMETIGKKKTIWSTKSKNKIGYLNLIQDSVWIAHSSGITACYSLSIWLCWFLWCTPVICSIRYSFGLFEPNTIKGKFTHYKEIRYVQMFFLTLKNENTFSRSKWIVMYFYAIYYLLAKWIFFLIKVLLKYFHLYIFYE